jgi:predicted transcriptional regulator
MAEESAAQTVDPSLVTRIIRSYVVHQSISITQLSDLISEVHRSLSKLGQDTPPQAPLVPAVSIRRSVQRDYVVCLECGFRGVAIRRHLNTKHGFEPQQYRARWKLPADYPITAPAYSERRATMAKKLGLGRSAVVSTPASEVVAPPPRRRGRKPRSAAAE